MPLTPTKALGRRKHYFQKETHSSSLFLNIGMKNKYIPMVAA